MYLGVWSASPGFFSNSDGVARRAWGHFFGECAEEKRQGAQCYLKKQNHHAGIFFQDTEKLSHPEQGKPRT